MLISKDIAFSNSDHSFTKFKVIPLVSLVCNVPDTIEESCYARQIVVTVKEAAFELKQSTSLRC